MSREAHVRFRERPRVKFPRPTRLLILRRKSKPLDKTKTRIKTFLEENLHLELNKDKTRVVPTNKGVHLLGYKVFYFHRLLRKRNVELFKERLAFWQKRPEENRIFAKDITPRIRGWVEYAKYGDSYKLRKKLFKDIVF